MTIKQKYSKPLTTDPCLVVRVAFDFSPPGFCYFVFPVPPSDSLGPLLLFSVDYILNVTREIDNFFPGLFAYHNIRVYDEETTDLLAHWNEAYHFINKAK